MPRITMPSDEKTRNYILTMMRALPKELLDLATEFRDLSTAIRNGATTLEQNLASLSARIDLLLQIARELSDLASKSTAIGPMWAAMQDSSKEEDA